MSLSWHQRKERLAVLLKSDGDDDADGLVLDRLMHGQTVIGKTAKTTEVDSLRFQDKDLDHVGTLDHGQYGVIDVVTCKIDNCVYVRKSVDKKFAQRTRDQCSPQFERDLLLQALKTQTPWAPHLLCAFQTPTHLKLVMDYAEGGTLWDVLESSPLDGRISEVDLRWWMPQVVSAIYWCHSQGFVHRDIKPHNFVLTTNAHILLIDFGSAAPLLPPNDDGSQLIPKRYCLVPCGTCDYISPEILQAHEEALVKMEMDSDDDEISVAKPSAADSVGYGLETDWWSLGAMLYEMAYGVAPFFAPDIRSTYLRIMNHEKSLKFDKNVAVSHELQHFFRRLLTTANKRLGRRNVMEITDHPIFDGIDWRSLQSQTAPSDLHLPQFVYSEPKSAVEQPKPAPAEEISHSSSQGFAFSALFQSSAASPGLSILRPSPTSSAYLHSSLSSSTTSSSFIGFSWGPTPDAFPRGQPTVARSPSPQQEPQATPNLFLRTPAYPQLTPVPASRTKSLAVPLTWGPGAFSTHSPLRGYNTPMKPYAASPHATLPRTSTIRRTAPRRNVSDREAMKQLVDCVGMSARKKVLESGKKPKFLSIFARSGSTNRTGKSSGFGTLRKELRFDKFSVPISGPDYSAASSAHDKSKSKSRSNSLSQSFSRIHSNSTTNMQQLSETAKRLPVNYQMTATTLQLTQRLRTLKVVDTLQVLVRAHVLVLPCP
ncbi:kinase-like domain-containing protein [Crepidotus variabilis]|uniref:non-specific serine/threonine protein kinase n=1 Tax=Crepidotus variabilis TaxID=179855 RepID=A0A9P6ELU6_9AGAR|nr:kinase-like domain-containing protein [Crepidotus variabilis]